MRHVLTLTLVFAAVAAACDDGDRDRAAGQTSFESAPPNGSAPNPTAGGADSGSGGTNAPPAAPPAVTTRTVEETDLYRLEGNRLYYLNSYRGLMVFDV